MEHPTAALEQESRYELRFASIFNAGSGYIFPCDRQGHVNIDTLGTKARANYLYARTLIGREFFSPVTCVARQPPRAVETS
jgi:hypothetical protein